MGIKIAEGVELSVLRLKDSRISDPPLKREYVLEFSTVKHHPLSAWFKRLMVVIREWLLEVVDELCCSRDEVSLALPLKQKEEKTKRANFGALTTAEEKKTWKDKEAEEETKRATFAEEEKTKRATFAEEEKTKRATFSTLCEGKTVDEKLEIWKTMNAQGVVE